MNCLLDEFNSIEFNLFGCGGGGGSSPLGTTMGIARVQFEGSGPPISSVPSSPCRPYRSGHVIDRPLVDSHPASPSGWCVSDPMVGVAW